jgi:hypothetical protein
VTSSDDSAWRRPPTADGDASQPAGPRPPAPPPSPFDSYSGPPPTNPPPTGWRPPVVARPPTPARLPEQNHDRIDVEEQAARTLTQGIGLVVGAVMLVLLLFLCARAIF